MKPRILKGAVLVVEIIGVILAVAAASVGYLLWRANQGPVELGLARQPIISAVNRQLPDGHRTDIDRVILVRDRDDGAYDVILDGLTISDSAGAPLLQLEAAIFNITGKEVFAGRLRPRRITLDRAVIEIRRDANRRFRVDYGARRGPRRGETNLSRLLKNSAYFQTVFESASLENATLKFFDEVTGRQWRSTRALANVTRNDKGFEAEVDAAFDTGAADATIKLDVALNQETGIVDAAIDVVDAPVSDILEVFYGPRALIMTAPVTGAARIKMRESGEILSSTISGRAAGGALHLGGGETMLNELALAASFDPVTDEFTVDQFVIDSDRISAEASGVVGVEFGGGIAAPTTVGFDIETKALRIAENDILQAPLTIDALALAGRYAIPERKLSVAEIDAQVLDLAATGSFDFEKPRATNGVPVSAGMRAALAVDGTLDPPRLLRLWPTTVGLGARDFIRDRISQATVTDIKLVLDVAPGAIDSAGGLPDEALALTFTLNDANVVYTPGMTPLTNARGTAVLSGNQFRVAAKSATVGDIKLTNGDVHFTAFRPRGAPSYFRFDADGRAREILTLLDQKPLELLKNVDIDPASFSGRAKAKIEIMRPNRRDVPRNAYEYRGKATFDGLDIDDLFSGLSVSDAAGEINLAPDQMRVTANARMNDAPIKINWLQKFFAAKDRLQFEVSGAFDSATGDIFGVATRQFLRGSVAFNARAVGDLGAIRTIDLQTDFTDAILLFEPIGWAKPRGAPAAGDLALNFTEAGVQLRDIAITGEGLSIAGDLLFSESGRLEGGAINQLFLENTANLNLRADRSAAGALDLVLLGEYLNAGPLLEAFSSGGGGGAAGGASANDGEAIDFAAIDWGGGVSVKSRLDRLELRNNVQYSDVDLEFWRDAERIQTLSVSARDQSGEPLSVALLMTGEASGKRQTVEARSDDIGALLSGLFGMRSIIGGQGVLDFFVRTGAAAGSEKETFTGLTGILEARQIKIVRMPLLAQIFAAGSFTGLSNLLNGDGIDISQAFAEFGFQDGALILRDLRAAGPSIGLSAEGRVAGEGAGGLDLNGAIAPVYQVNSFLGKTPILGELFVNKEGEGVVALSYKVSGAPSAPVVAVNPLSALTPGFLRRLFEPERPSIEEMMEEPPEENAEPN